MCKAWGRVFLTLSGVDASLVKNRLQWWVSVTQVKEYKMLRYRVLNIGLIAAAGLILSAGVARAQVVRNAPSTNDVYCSGTVTDQRVPDDTYLISGENSSYKLIFHPDDYVFINRGASKGVKVGDEFEVIRPVSDDMESTTLFKLPESTMWFKYQAMLSHAMGTTYADIGRLRVVHVDEKTATAQSVLACDYMQRGDILRPFAERPAPPFHDAKLDLFAPPSGKKLAMVVNTKDFGQIAGAGKIVYVNLGSAQGVQVGNYFRVFRYQATHNDLIYQISDMAYRVYGFGSAPVAYQWNDLPRQVIGEGIVLRTGPNASTVLVTTTRGEIYAGDYVEVE